jgi:hypothetical protein
MDAHTMGRKIMSRASLSVGALMLALGACSTPPEGLLDFCDGIDDDGDGLIDEGVGEAVGCQSGERCVEGLCDACGDGMCDAVDGETCGSCEADCGACPRCGDGLCNGSDSCSSCPADCGACPRCGDGACNGSDSCDSCPADCGACPSCGDGTCNGGETCTSCSGDCGLCPGECRACGADFSCPFGLECASRYCDGAEACYGTRADAACPEVDGDPCPSAWAYERCTSDAECGPRMACRDGHCTPVEFSETWLCDRPAFCPLAPPSPAGLTAECVQMPAAVGRPCCNYYCVLRCTSTCPYGMTCTGGVCV